MLTFEVILKAGYAIGTGHLTRVLGLMEELCKLSRVPLRFHLVSDLLAPELLPLCAPFESVTVLKSFDELPGVSATLHPDLVLFDHYFVDAHTERRLRSLRPAPRLAVIDDLANRPHEADLLIDQGLLRKAGDYTDLVPPHCRLCTGPGYALTRPVFATLKRRPLPPRPAVLLNFGGADPAHALLFTLRSVLEAGLQERYTFTVLSGLSNRDGEELVRLCALHGLNFLTHTDHVPALFESHDLAIGALGGMFLERLAAGLPSIHVEVADNQRGGAYVVERLDLGLTLHLEDLQRPACVAAALDALRTRAPDFTRRCRHVLDGRGLLRSATALLELVDTVDVQG